MIRNLSTRLNVLMLLVGFYLLSLPINLAAEQSEVAGQVAPVTPASVTESKNQPQNSTHVQAQPQIPVPTSDKPVATQAVVAEPQSLSPLSKPVITSKREISATRESGRVLLGLMVVLAAIFALAWLIKRSGISSSFSQGQIKVVTGLSLGSREKVVVVQVGKEQILLGVTPTHIEKLHVLPENLEAKEGNISLFADKLKQASQRKGNVNSENPESSAS